jgi:arsenite-transporting ATPase
LELNIQKEIKRHWQEISSYVSSVLRTTGISGVEAEELAILPGMEELSAMMYINQYRREQSYDVIVLDAAPTAESMRFISMPTTLDWYMKHIFPFERNLLKAVRPIANRVAPFELPTDSYNTSSIFAICLRSSREWTTSWRIRRRRACDWSRTPRKWCCARRSGRLYTSLSMG